jgi:limonene-1,2-epoxide hydrolase
MKSHTALSVCASFLLASFACAVDVKPSMEDTSHHADVVTAFVAAINRHDVAALANLMSEGHTFIDSSGRSVSGRNEVIAGWEAYFTMFPDFEVRADTTLTHDGTVAVFGSVSGTYNGKRGLISRNRIAMPAAWKAIVADGKVTVWQVFCDWTEGMKIIQEDKQSG